MNRLSYVNGFFYEQQLLEGGGIRFKIEHRGSYRVVTFAQSELTDDDFVRRKLNAAEVEIKSELKELATVPGQLATPIREMKDL